MNDIVTVYEIGGMVFTIAIALITYFRSAADHKTSNTTFVTVLGVVLTMLISLRFDVLPQIRKNLVSAERLSSNQRLRNLAEKLDGALQKASIAKEPLMTYVLNIRLDDLEVQLDSIASGQFIVGEHEMPGFSLELIKSAKVSFDVTSYVQFKAWWDTPWGRQYEAENVTAVKRGVKIRRTFIFSKQVEFDAAKVHLAEQKKGGIEVYTVFAADLPSQVTSDLVVLDGRVAGELSLTPEKGLKEARFFTAKRDIDRCQRDIEQIRLNATPLSNIP